MPIMEVELISFDTKLESSTGGRKEESASLGGGGGKRTLDG